MSSRLDPVWRSSWTRGLGTWLQFGLLGTILACLAGLASSAAAKIQEAQDRVH
jgi:hypothetical protein